VYIFKTRILCIYFFEYYQNKIISTKLNYIVLFFYESIPLGEVKCDIKVTASVGVSRLTEMSVERMALKYKLRTNYL